MPAPLANRFLHLEVSVDLAAFRRHALQQGINEKICLFSLSDQNFYTELIPQSQLAISTLMGVRIKVIKRWSKYRSRCGVGPAAEFEAYEAIYQDLPELDKVLSGKLNPKFPKEPSQRYATVLGLLSGQITSHLLNAFKYLASRAPAEWVQLFSSEAIPMLRELDGTQKLAKLIKEDKAVAKFMAEFRDLLGL